MIYKRKGFTLVELLVVLAILTILIALTVPALRMAFEKGKRTQGTALIVEIEAALIAYKAEYGNWPPALNTFTNADGDIFIPAAGASSGWGDVYRSLSGYSNDSAGYVVNNTTNNSRRIHFIDFAPGCLSAQITPPFQTGATDPATVQNLIDPWGGLYQLILDVNGDSKIKVPDVQKKDGSWVEIPRSVGVWSQGGDSDNALQFIATWK